MIYLGNQPIGLLVNMPDWGYTAKHITFNRFWSFDTALTFFADASVSPIISTLGNKTYKIIFENNTENTRAGQYIKFTIENGSIITSSIKVMRVGMTVPSGSSYGVDVYENADAKIYAYIGGDPDNA